ncbi:hypothetical protein DFR70_12664 [Nocardia tenerifensis]|uniref:Uncharacterized protein n=1 Tax=Nocardia tenerifensis TaxID=228006 RepID=A0A318JT74_9NOCA|nr:hypothetical protein [Nocardia tenerifensis]PXX53943.1 hypothetical protein DFR70_12664 [Nocardia tenerifensis]
MTALAGARIPLDDLVFFARCGIRAARAELRYCRALRLALLVRAHGGGWRRVLRTLVGTYDVTTVCLGGHWFLIGPADPRTLDRAPERARWAWYICGPSLDRTVNPSLSWEESAPGFLPRTALAYCGEWADAVGAESPRRAA